MKNNESFIEEYKRCLVQCEPGNKLPEFDDEKIYDPAFIKGIKNE